MYRRLQSSQKLSLVGVLTIAVKPLEIIAVFSHWQRLFCLRQDDCQGRNVFILSCQSSIIADNDIGNGKIKYSLNGYGRHTNDIK